MRTLWFVDHGLQGVSEAMRHSIGITGRQRLVLRIVALNPGIAPGELASVLHLHPSTVTGLVKRLRAQGYLTRSADPDDARRVVLTPTAKGKALGEQPGPIEERIERALRRVGPSGVAFAETVLRAIAQSIAGQDGP